MEIINHVLLSNLTPGCVIWDSRNGDLLKILSVDLGKATIHTDMIFSTNPVKTEKTFGKEDLIYLGDLNELFRRLSPEMKAAIGILMADVTGLKLAMQQIFKEISRASDIKVSDGGIVY
jgi:hypothetical protein